MRRFLFSACIASLTLLASPRAFADDADNCDMLCRLRGYLATDHMAPASSDATGPRTGGGKRQRSAAATHKPKPARAAASAPIAPDVVVAKPAPATKTAEVHPTRLKTASVAATKPAPALKTQRPRPVAKAASLTPRTVVAARTEAPTPRRVVAAVPAVSPIPLKRVAARVAAVTPPQASSLPIQTAAAADRTTIPSAPIPGSAPLVAAGFR